MRYKRKKTNTLLQTDAIIILIGIHEHGCGFCRPYGENANFIYEDCTQKKKKLLILKSKIGTLTSNM